VNGTRPVPARTVAAIGRRLGLAPARVAQMIAAEDAAAVVHGVTRPSFRPDCRWLARVTGVPLDRINIALHALIRDGRLRMVSARKWSVTQS